MPRIPLLPQLQSNAAPLVRTPLDAGDAGGEAIAKGLSRFGAGLESAGQDLGMLYKAEKQKAQAVAVTNAETEFARAVNAQLLGEETVEPLAAGLSPEDAFNAEVRRGRRRGFMELRGEAAAAASADTVDALRKLQQDVASKVSDAEARRLFLQRSGGQLESAVAKVEGHVGGEVRAAGLSALKARVNVALDEVARAAGTTDEMAALEKLAEVEGPVRALSLSKEEADSTLADFRAQAAEVRLEKRLASQDWRGAEALWAQVKDSVRAESRPRLEKAMATLRLDGQAEELVDKVSALNGVRMKDGRLDEGEAFKALESATAQDEKLRSEARVRLRQRIHDVEQAWAQDTKDVGRRAFSVYNQKGWSGIPAGLKAELNERDPALYNRLYDDATARYRRARGDVDSSRREQTEANRLAMQAYMKLPLEERTGLAVPQFLAGFGADKVGVGAVEVQQRKDKDALQRGAGVAESNFVQDTMAAAAGIITQKKQREVLEAEARLAHTQFEQANKRPPNRDESKRLTDSLLRTVTIERPYWFDSEKPEFERRAEERREAARQQPAAPVPPPAAPAAAPAASGGVPPLPNPRPTAAQRAAQLKSAGLNNLQIANQLNADGY